MPWDPPEVDPHRSGPMGVSSNPSSSPASSAASAAINDGGRQSTMDMAPGNMIASGIGAAGGVISAAMSAGAQKDINDDNLAYAREATDKNEAFAREQMAFQERMSNSAYQRTVDDMKKAGINPMMAFSQGGASSPSGASGSAAQYKGDAVDYGKIVERGLSGAMDVARFKKDREQQDSQIALNETAKDVAENDAVLKGASAYKTQIEAEKVKTQKALADTELSAAKAEAKTRIKQADVGGQKADWDKSMMRYDQTTRRIKEAAGIINSATSALKPWGGTSRNNDFTTEGGSVINKRTGEVYDSYRGD